MCMKYIYVFNYLFNRNRVIVLSFIMIILMEVFIYIVLIDLILEKDVWNKYDFFFN